MIAAFITLVTVVNLYFSFYTQKSPATFFTPCTFLDVIVQRRVKISTTKDFTGFISLIRSEFKTNYRKNNQDKESINMNYYSLRKEDEVNPIPSILKQGYIHKMDWPPRKFRKFCPVLLLIILAVPRQ